MSSLIFAYGSFSPGRVHFNKISQLITKQKTGWVRGQVMRLRCGFPALNPLDGQDLIEGQVYELKVPFSYWNILDELLGIDPQKPDRSLWVRQVVDVLVDNFSKLPCQAYCLNTNKRAHLYKKITGGAWQSDLTKNPPITSLLQSRHREYLIKLSRSRGRDIVPIKLDLYRELLNMELIVDKGRRLALTPLGEEAALFLDA